MLKSQGAVAADHLRSALACPPPSQIERRHSRLQRGTGAADAVRAALSGARRARHHATSACSSTTAARTARRRCCASSFSSGRDETRVVLFHANFGQHSAVMAGLAYARGEYVITLDADLQNPPEEIGKLVEKLDQGYDYVGTIRRQAPGPPVAPIALEGRQQAARVDHAGAHHRSGLHDARLFALVVAALNQTREVNTFIPALASLYAMNPIEVPIAHEERHAGESKYSLVQPDPPEFRSDHRLLGGAAAAVLHGRHGGVARCPRSW